MAFSRTKMATAVAATLSVAVLAGCPAPTTGTNPTPAPTGSAATTAPTGAPTGNPTDMPTGVPTGTESGTPGPTTSAPPPTGKVVTVRGDVYDESGATVDGATITVRSLLASSPYEATVQTVAGAWVVNNVPEGVNVEIIATKDGYTERRRVNSFQQQQTGRNNEVDFGSSGSSSSNNDSDDTSGRAYFISDYPEIEMTSPGQDDTGVDVSKLTYKLTFSEPMTEDSRDNIEDMFTIFPANPEANGDRSPTVAQTQAAVASGTIADLELLGDINEDALDDAASTVQSTGTLGTSAGVQYTLGNNDSFLGSTSNKLRASWNAEGTEVTFTFNAGLLASDNDDAKYNVGLFSIGNTSDDKAEDEDGNQLGTNATGSLSQYPDPGFLVLNAFKEEDLALAGTTGGTLSTRNWASTHDSGAWFEAKRDTTDPKLTSVETSDETEGTRIELTFSEPMAAYDGANGFISNEVKVLENYHFAVGKDRGDLDDVDLDGDGTIDELQLSSGSATASFSAFVGNGTGQVSLEEEFSLDTGDLATPATTLAAATNGTIFVEVDEDNPSTIFLWFKGRQDFFRSYSELKAYVENVEDPAGNAISDSDAEANVVKTTL